MFKKLLFSVLLSVSSTHAQNVVDGSAGISAGSTVTTTPQPIASPQSMADLQATCAWMYIQIQNLQAALQNQQSQLTTLENNPVLTLGQFVSQSSTPPVGWAPRVSLNVITIPSTAPSLTLQMRYP